MSPSVTDHPVMVDSLNAYSQPLPTNNLAAVDQGVHAFKCPEKGGVRSVCPALNALANHSYLPHDGRNITFYNLVHALEKGYGVSKGFACFLAIGSYILLKRSPLEPLDLHEISRHGYIEHNASAVHDDADLGSEDAPCEVDLDLLNKFLRKVYSPPAPHEPGCEDVITVDDLAHMRIAREASSGIIDTIHSEIARGEFAMVLDIFGHGTEKKLDPAELKVWLQENRFPDGWAPNHKETIFHTIAESKKMRDLVNRYRSGGEQMDHHGVWSSIEKALERLLQRVVPPAYVHNTPHTAVNGGEKHDS